VFGSVPPTASTGRANSSSAHGTPRHDQPVLRPRGAVGRHCPRVRTRMTTISIMGASGNAASPSRQRRFGRGRRSRLSVASQYHGECPSELIRGSIRISASHCRRAARPECWDNRIHMSPNNREGRGTLRRPSATTIEGPPRSEITNENEHAHDKRGAAAWFVDDFDKPRLGGGHPPRLSRC
jgi:hypothetical protein